MKRTMALFLALALLLLTACGGPAYQAEELKGDAPAAPAAPRRAAAVFKILPIF